MPKPSSPLSWLILPWLLCVGLGFLALGAYHATPGGRGVPPDSWPSDVPIPLDRSMPTLLIFIHPRCPCSPASLDELARVATLCPGRFAGHVIAFRPDAAAGGLEDWTDGDEVAPAGMVSWGDPGGRLAGRFGVETSGHVLLFDPSGRRTFDGGITISRGHRGDNPGLDRLIAAIRSESTAPASSPVFGCPELAPSPDRAGRSTP